MSELLRAVRRLVDMLNASAASGLIDREALILLGEVQRLLSKVEREIAAAQAEQEQEGSGT